MECKGIFDSQHSRIIYDLIDTLWNVKLVIDNTGFSPAADLIDTLWNVKHSQANSAFLKCADLIDTLWNVKNNQITVKI